MRDADHHELVCSCSQYGDEMNTEEPTIETNTPPETEQEVEVKPEAQSEAEPGQASEKVDKAPPDLRDMRIQMLERALSERETTLHSYIRAHKKAEADFEAFKQRLERDRDKELNLARIKLVERLLDVDDNLERTADAARRGTADSLPAIVKGVELVHKLFLERLIELGLERVDPIGKAFDPTSMEALGVVPVDDAARHDTVVATFRAGYRVGDQEIRPALVQVGRLLS
jgi:molecular chaperone GrpE